MCPSVGTVLKKAKPLNKLRPDCRGYSVCRLGTCFFNHLVDDPLRNRLVLLSVEILHFLQILHRGNGGNRGNLDTFITQTSAKERKQNQYNLL